MRAGATPRAAAPRGAAAPIEATGPGPRAIPAPDLKGPAPRRAALADPPEFRWPSPRPVLVVLALFVLVGGLGYPVAVDLVERGTGALAPSGNLVAGGDPSALADGALGQNITNLSLFWLRPSTTDYNTTLGLVDTPFGATDPNLVNLTRYYIGVYGLNNTTVPLDLVGESGSGLDPDLTPAAALVQIPRVSAHSHFTEPYLTALVAAHIVEPAGGLVGPEYVNVILLDEALLALETGPAPP